MKTNKLEPCVSDNDRQKRKRPKTNCTCFQKLSLKKKNVVYRSSRLEVFCKKGVLNKLYLFLKNPFKKEKCSLQKQSSGGVL